MTIKTTKTTREVIEEAYAAVGAGDGDTFASLLADDVTLQEPDNHPWPGTWTSKAQVLEAFPSITAAMGLRGVTVHEIIVDGDRAVGLVSIDCTSKSGKHYTINAAETWRIRDGLIVDIRIYYWDTAALVAAAAD